MTATLALVLALGFASPLRAQEHVHDGAVGASVEDLVAIAKSMNPEVQAMALEADAAAARVEGAGSLMDPKVTFLVEGWQRDFPSYAPRSSSGGTDKTVRVTQELPFWGKRDLKREIAEADAKKARVLTRAVENDLVARVKVAYAEYHQAHLAIDLATNLRGRLDTLTRLASVRYAQAVGRQQDVTRASVEKSLLDTEIARMQAERRKARVKINRLLNRDLSAPLVEAPVLRPIPAKEALDVAALTERAQSSNPELLAEEAVIAGADKSVALAEKSWYPDFEVGVGAMRQEGRWDNYEAMLTMNVPIQWGLRRSDIGEAKAMSAAARQRRQARRVELGNEVQDAYIGLEASRQVETILRESALPQAEIGFQAAARSYELGRSEFLDVLTAEQQLWKTQIDLLKVQFDQQMRLAEIEKLIGGEL
jgi:Outer membrane protein